MPAQKINKTLPVIESELGLMQIYIYIRECVRVYSGKNLL